MSPRPGQRKRMPAAQRAPAVRVVAEEWAVVGVKGVDDAAEAWAGAVEDASASRRPAGWRSGRLELALEVDYCRGPGNGS